MARRAESEKGASQPKSMADIAATLIQTVNEAPDDAAETDDEVLEAVKDTVPTDGELDDTSEEEVQETSDEPEDEQSSEDGGEEQEGDEQPDDEPDEDAEPEYFDINDDDLITVVVDGEEQEVSIGDLKKAHSLGGATEKRLQEATEMRKTAHAERTQMLEKLAAEERALTEALSELDDTVFTPVISAPPEDLKRTNPGQYLRHKEAYDQDQQRISEAKKAVETKLNTIKQTREQRLKEYSTKVGPMLVEAIPELGDQKQAPVMVEKLRETAKAYGYTDQEIQNALDPRMFLLVRDAMRLAEMNARNKERPNVEKLKGQTGQKVRRLRSGSTSTAKARARQKDTERQKVVEKARASGKVQDVAATLLKPRQSRG
jgi:hypothetical protein